MDEAARTVETGETPRPAEPDNGRDSTVEASSETSTGASETERTGSRPTRARERSGESETAANGRRAEADAEAGGADGRGTGARGAEVSLVKPRARGSAVDEDTGKPADAVTAKAEARVEVKPEAEPGPKPGTDSGPGPGPKSGARTASKAGAKAGPKVESEPGPKTAPKAGPKSGAGAGPKSESTPDPKSEATPDPKSEATSGPKAKADTTAEAEADSENDGAGEGGETGTDGGSDASAAAKTAVVLEKAAAAKKAVATTKADTKTKTADTETDPDTAADKVADKASDKVSDRRPVKVAEKAASTLAPVRTGKPDVEPDAPDESDASEDEDDDDSEESGRRRRLPAWVELPLLLAFGLLVVVVLHSYVAQPFVIPSGSMENTLEIGDRVLVNKLAYTFGDRPQRGDIVVFDGTGVFTDEGERKASDPFGRAVEGFVSIFGFGNSDETDFVKRVIGVGGDRVVCCDAQGRLTVNGVPLDESGYLYPGNAPSTVRFDVIVPPGELWVMGDHRANSADSREHMGRPGGGFVPEDRVVGRVDWIIWPVSRMGGVGRPPTFSQPGIDRQEHPAVPSRG